MKRWMRRLCAGMALWMALTGVARAEDFLNWVNGGDEEEWALPAATPSPEERIPQSALEDDGWVRVYLRSLDAPSQLHLTLAGKYAVEGDRGFRFERGTELTLYVEDGEVWMTAGGVTIDMGLGVTLTRHASMEEVNGLYIAEAEQHNLYCGDLSVSVMETALRPVLKIQVEDYLKGVVAYEMSDSFPLEALKAQAVAARTYALRKKQTSRKRDYDVVDTTADQVYKGYDPEYENVIDAVNATRGIVGVYNGTYATCYYTASNGGQTALASQIWGESANDAYLAMVDDPSDLENPRSLVSDLTFSDTCEGSLKLRQMLTDALAVVMRQEGFADDAWSLDSIAEIEPVEPRFEGSKMYDGLAFDLRVRVAESALPTPEPSETPSASAEASATPAPTPAGEMSVAPESERWVDLEDTRRVVLDVYRDIKDGLAMGLNGSDVELISVDTQRGADGRATQFRLEMRRFGHGVGMSQRGAQWMAGQEGKGFVDILNFYYPGLTLERMTWQEAALTSLMEVETAVGAARPKPTPTPSPAPLPQLRSGEHYAKVAVAGLNLREGPTTSARILDILDLGTRLIVAGDPDADGWVPVKTGDEEGYVKEEYLVNP